MPGDTHTHTQTHKQTNMHRIKHTHAQTQAQTQAYMRTHMQTRTHARTHNTHMHRLERANAYMRTHINAITHAHIYITQVIPHDMCACFFWSLRHNSLIFSFQWERYPNCREQTGKGTGKGIDCLSDKHTIPAILQYANIVSLNPP